MALPKKLKDLNLFSNGESWQGIVQSITLPTLTRKIEEWRGGGMDGAVGIDMGQDGLLTVQWTVGGLVESLFDNFGTARIDADMLRMTGSYERKRCDLKRSDRHRPKKVSTTADEKKKQSQALTVCPAPL